MKVMKTRVLRTGRLEILRSGDVKVWDLWTENNVVIPRYELMAAAKFLLEAAERTAVDKPLGMIIPSAP